MSCVLSCRSVPWVCAHAWARVFMCLPEACSLPPTAGWECHQTRFILLDVQPAKILWCWGLQQREGLFVKQSSKKTREQISNLLPPKQRPWGVYEIKKRETGQTGMGNSGRGDWEKVWYLMFCAGITRLPALVCSEDGIFSPLISKRHWEGAHMCPVERLVVLPSRNQLSLNWTQLTPD